MPVLIACRVIFNIQFSYFSYYIVRFYGTSRIGEPGFVSDKIPLIEE